METNIDKNGKGEIILYQPDDNIRLEVRMEGDTVWLTQQQMAELFQRDRTVIGRHIKKIFEEGELDASVVCANFAHTTPHGAIQDKWQNNEIVMYNLDVIISVGYRVKSMRGTQFRIWATQTLKNVLLRGYAVSQRIESLERRVDEHDKQIGFFVRTALPPVQGVFYDGQIFDAYTFASDLIRSARERIMLIDNYVDDSVLKMLTKRGEGVSASIVTKHISDTLALDIERHNRQYPPVEVLTSNRFHDRFIILDDTVYHLGASLKDLGKKLFAFCRMTLDVSMLMGN
ncbi:MAG: virulence RhuM family protein [Bacteroidales bacterium]|nr:virulence RhuM family protein [Bacteroidales bacterium]MBO7646470.1 virulence RhuM family protein [Bacteroidales bacterium]